MKGISKEFADIGWTRNEIDVLHQDGLTSLLKTSERRIKRPAWEEKRLLAFQPSTLSTPGWWLGEVLSGHDRTPEAVVVGVCIPTDPKKLRVWEENGPSIEAIVMLDCACRAARSMSAQFIVYVPEHEVMREVGSIESVSAVAKRLINSIHRRYGNSAEIRRTALLDTQSAHVSACLAEMFPQRIPVPFGLHTASTWTELAFIATILTYAEEGLGGRDSMLVYDHDQLRCALYAQELVFRMGKKVPRGMVHLPVPASAWKNDMKGSWDQHRRWRERINGTPKAKGYVHRNTVRRMYSGDENPVCLYSPDARVLDYNQPDNWLNYVTNSMIMNCRSANIDYSGLSPQEIVDAYRETPPL